MAALDQLSGLMDLIQGIQGGSTTTTSSGGSQTTQTNLSDAAVQEQIKRILAGSGGVRDIGGSARRSGLYNSTSEDLLLGNLYSTAANQGEIARASTVTTTTPQTKTSTTPGADLGTLAAVVGGGAALNAILNSSTAKGLGNSALDLIGLGGAGSDSPIAGPLPGVDFGLSGLLGGTPGFGASVNFDEGNGAGTFTGDSFNAQMSQGLPGVGGTTGSSGTNIGADSEFDLLGSIGSAVSGFFSGGGLGGLVGAVQGGFGGGSSGGGGVSGGSIICTALMTRGLLNADHYAKGEAYISKVPMEVKVGYYSWAAPIAKKIREGDRFWTTVCLPFARGRTALLATNGTLMDHVRNPLGTLTKFVGEPICSIIGKYQLRKVLTPATSE